MSLLSPNAPRDSDGWIQSDSGEQANHMDPGAEESSGLDDWGGGR